MRFVFANAGGFAPPKQLQRALQVNGVTAALFSYYYLLKWDPKWVERYVLTGETFP